MSGDQAALGFRRYTMRLQTVSVVAETVDDPPPHVGKMADQPAIAAEIIAGLLRQTDPDQETFGFLALDQRHRVIGFKVLSVGTATQAPVDGRKLFRCALTMGAAGVLLYHNHPSGDLDPSRDDLDLTRRLVMGGNLIGVTVHDHFLYASPGRWLSLRSARAELFSG